MKKKFSKLLSLMLTALMIFSCCGISVLAEDEASPSATTITKTIYVSEELGTNNSSAVYYKNNSESKVRYYKFNVDGVKDSMSFAGSASFNVKLHQNANYAGHDKSKLAIYEVPSTSWSNKDNYATISANVSPATYATAENKINAAGNEGETTSANEVVKFDVKNYLTSLTDSKASFMLCCPNDTNYKAIWSLTMYPQGGLSTAPSIKIEYNFNEILGALKTVDAGALKAVAFPLDLNIGKFNMLNESGKKVVLDALKNGEFATPLAVKQAYDNAFSSLTYKDTANKISITKNGKLKLESGLHNNLAFNLENTINNAQIWGADISSLKNKADVISKVEFHAIRQNTSANVGNTEVIFSDFNVDTLEQIDSMKSVNINSSNTISSIEENTLLKNIDFSRKTVDYSEYMLNGVSNAQICADVTDFVKEDLASNKNVTVFTMNYGVSEKSSGNDPLWIRPIEQEKTSYLAVTYDKMAVISKIKDMTSTKAIEEYLTEWKDVLGISNKTAEFSDIAICLYKNSDVNSIEAFENIVTNAKTEAPKIALGKINGATTEADVIDAINIYGEILGVDTLEFNNLSTESKNIVAKAVVEGKGNGYANAEAIEKVLNEAIAPLAGSVVVTATENILYRNGAFGNTISNEGYQNWNPSDTYIKFPMNEKIIKADAKYILSAKATVNFINHSQDNGNWTATYYDVNTDWNDKNYSTYTSETKASLDSGKQIGKGTQQFYQAEKGLPQIGVPSVTTDITDYVKNNATANYISVRAKLERTDPEITGRTKGGYKRIYTAYDINSAPYLTIKYDTNALISDLNKLTAENAGVFIMTNGGALEFDIDTYNALSDKSTVINAIIGKNFKTVDGAKGTFNNAVKKSVATKQLDCTFTANQYGNIDANVGNSTKYAEISFKVPEDYDSTYVSSVQFHEKRAGVGNDGPANIVFTNLTDENNKQYIMQHYSPVVDKEETFDITSIFNSATKGSTFTFGVQRASSGRSVSLSSKFVYVRINYDLARIMNDAAKAENPKDLLTKYQDVLGITNVDAVASLLNGKTNIDAVYARNLIIAGNNNMTMHADIEDDKVVVTNFSNSTNADVMVAFYGENNKFLGVTTINNEAKTISDNASFTYTKPAGEDVYYAKVFVWDSVSGLKPLALSSQINFDVEK